MVCSTPTHWFRLFSDGDRLAVCSWDGDVWLVSGILGQFNVDQNKKAEPSSSTPPRPRQLTWRRIANGLFQPLGLKIVDDQIYVTCRDQLAVLRDLNGDGETDFIECFNSDHQVTERSMNSPWACRWIKQETLLCQVGSARIAGRCAPPWNVTSRQHRRV